MIALAEGHEDQQIGFNQVADINGQAMGQITDGILHNINYAKNCLFTKMSGSLMRYPNLRYGNPAEMVYYTAGVSLADLARLLRRDERTVRDWLSGRRRVPWWVPELLRLRHEAAANYSRQMNYETAQPTLGRVTRAGVVELHPLDVKKP